MIFKVVSFIDNLLLCLYQIRYILGFVHRLIYYKNWWVIR